MNGMYKGMDGWEGIDGWEGVGYAMGEGEEPEAG